jgi:LysM repeat protein
MRRLRWVIPLVLLLSLLISSVAFAAPAQTWPYGGGYWYTVRWGDTLFSIGRATGVNPWAIASANGIGAPYTIYAGRSLWIPGSAPGPYPRPYPGPYPGPRPGCGYWHPVYFGDTLYSISRATGVNAWSIARANGLGITSVIYAGSSLFIPCW